MSESAVAVVVPAFDAAATILATLRSALDQSAPPAEVVVVDDGSRDATADVVAELAAHEPLLRLVRQDNAGPAAARNTGLRATTSPLVAFLDADDLFAPAKLARQTAVLTSSPEVSAVATDAWHFVGTPANAGDTQPAGPRHNARRRVAPRLELADLLADNPIVASSVLARRRAIVAAGSFDEDPLLIATEDYDLWLRLVAHGPIAYLDEPLTGYRRAGGSLGSERRFVTGIDRAIAKLAAVGALDDPELARLAAGRRAAARRDLAWQVLRGGGSRHEVRRLLADVARLGGRDAGWWKSWLRACLPW